MTKPWEKRVSTTPVKKSLQSILVDIGFNENLRISQGDRVWAFQREKGDTITDQRAALERIILLVAADKKIAGGRDAALIEAQNLYAEYGTPCNVKGRPPKTAEDLVARIEKSLGVNTQSLHSHS